MYGLDLSLKTQIILCSLQINVISPVGLESHRRSMFSSIDTLHPFQYLLICLVNQSRLF